MSSKVKAPLNRTISLTEKEINFFKEKLFRVNKSLTVNELKNKIINGDVFRVMQFLPDKFVDLLFIDPPYNLHKKFNSNSFKEMSDETYSAWIDSWLSGLVRILKPNASVYICCDWRSSNAVYNSVKKYLIIQNRITWEREKGRGAKSNWKNCTEDIWFCTMSKDYVFNVEEVKLRRRVIAPYKDESGAPKDWQKLDEKSNVRLTHPSNIWTDITVPFWSMPENTEHPTQKPEKLLAKIILASSNNGDMIFDPFMGSGTTAVTAKKLGRNYSGIEVDELYCCLAEKRLKIAESDKTIQGYEDGVFWERNTLSERKLKLR